MAGLPAEASGPRWPVDGPYPNGSQTLLTESRGATSKRDKRPKRVERERRIGAMRAGVQLYVEYERDIRELESERDALADADDRSGFREFVSSERGRRLADFYQRRIAYERGQLSISPSAPIASRNSYLQEAILEALADGELVFSGRILLVWVLRARLRGSGRPCRGRCGGFRPRGSSRLGNPRRAAGQELSMGLAHEWALSAPPGPMRRSGGLLGAPDSPRRRVAWRA